MNLRAFTFAVAILFAAVAQAQIILKQSTASQYVGVVLIDSTDHLTEKTGQTSPTITATKGGASGSAALNDGTWIEGAHGCYQIQLDATDTNTLGPMMIYVTKAGCDNARVLAQVVANIESDTYARLGAPAGASTAADIAAVKTVVDAGATASALSTAQTDITTIKGYTDDIGVAGAGLTALGDTRIANLDAAVSTRSTYAGADTAGTTTLLSRLTATRAGYLDNLTNLDAAVSTRSTLTAANVWDTLLTAVTTPDTVGKLLKDNLDAAVSTRSTLAAGAQMDLVNAPNATALTAMGTAVWANGTRTLSSYGTLVADIWASATRTLSAFAFTPTPSNAADTTAIKAKTDSLTFTVANQVDANALTGGGGGTAADIADAVWDELLTGHAIDTSAGKYLATAGAGGVDTDALATSLYDHAIGTPTPNTMGQAIYNGALNSGTGTTLYTPPSLTASGSPVEGAEVYITADAAGTGTRLRGGQYTDSAGNIAGYWLNAGTYYRHATKAGYSFPHVQFTVTP